MERPRPCLRQLPGRDVLTLTLAAMSATALLAACGAASSPQTAQSRAQGTVPTVTAERRAESVTTLSPHSTKPLPPTAGGGSGAFGTNSAAVLWQKCVVARDRPSYLSCTNTPLGTERQPVSTVWRKSSVLAPPPRAPRRNTVGFR